MGRGGKDLMWGLIPTHLCSISLRGAFNNNGIIWDALKRESSPGFIKIGRRCNNYWKYRLLWMLLDNIKLWRQKSYIIFSTQFITISQGLMAHLRYLRFGKRWGREEEAEMRLKGEAEIGQGEDTQMKLRWGHPDEDTQMRTDWRGQDEMRPR